MAEWTHRLCERCWFDGPYGTDENGFYVRPVQVKIVEPGACCSCGGMTITGIYARGPQEEFLCLGQHDQVEKWSALVKTDVPV
jgi:hypothetical protein